MNTRWLQTTKCKKQKQKWKKSILLKNYDYKEENILLTYNKRIYEDDVDRGINIFCFKFHPVHFRNIKFNNKWNRMKIVIVVILKII